MMHDTTFKPCEVPEGLVSSGICFPASEGMTRTSGGDVLIGLGTVYGVVRNEDTFVDDIVVLLTMAIAYKVLYFTGVMYKTGRVSKIETP